MCRSKSYGPEDAKNASIFVNGTIVVALLIAGLMLLVGKIIPLVANEALQVALRVVGGGLAVIGLIVLVAGFVRCTVSAWREKKNGGPWDE